MATTSFSMVTLLCLFNIRSSNSCKWTIQHNEQELTLDLSCLSGKTLQASQLDNNGIVVNDYKFSVCQNTQSCDNLNVMAAQFPVNLAPRCFNVGTYDPSVYPMYSETTSGGQWEFTYIGDPQDCSPPGREWIPTFICDSTTEYQIGVVSESTKCDYSVPIRTKYACVDKHYECGSSSAAGLSGGWIFIIIFLSAFFLYCIVGYVVMAKTVNKDKGFGDFSNNIPNKTLWVKCMFLVLAGCSVTKEYLMSKLRKNDEHDDGVSDGESEDGSISNDGYQLDLDTN